jgi:hypothetical protein
VALPSKFKKAATRSVALALAGPETLTLATYQQGAKPEPISLGCETITQITASAIYFHKSAASSVFDGRMDRITGDVEGHAASYKSTKGTDMLKPDNVVS